MWSKPWTYREGTAVVAALLIVGALLQLTVGPIDWDIMAWPVNIIVGVMLTGCIVVVSMFRRRSRALQFVCSRYAAVPVLIVAAVATAVYGVTNMRETLSCWPFVLLYLWMDVIVGFVTLRFLRPTLRNLCITASHAGLFIALTAATLGSADMQRLRMQIGGEQSERRAVDDGGMVHELPFAVRLNGFSIDEYPPQLIVIDDMTGEAMPADKPQSIVLEDSVAEGDIVGYHIVVRRLYDCAEEVLAEDTVSYAPWNHSGATTAALVGVSREGRTLVESGWVANGSYMFPGRTIRLDDHHSLMMPAREPKRYASDITVHTKGGHEEHAVVEVNKPYDIDGWKIYQLSYDEDMGRWSTMSVVGLVCDPWLPAVYAGIMLLIAGAIMMFLTAGRKEER